MKKERKEDQREDTQKNMSSRCPDTRTEYQCQRKIIQNQNKTRKEKQTLIKILKKGRKKKKKRKEKKKERY